MQKKIIALAVAGLVSGAAFAQSNVTVYGAVDLGESWVSISNPNPTSDQSTVARLDNNSSHIGFKGVEDLGNGLKAVFQLETGINPDSGTGWGASRDSYVGLSSGFGTVVAGTLTHPLRALGSKVELMPAAAGIGTMASVTGTFAGIKTGADDRANNAVAYVSPNFSGFTVTGAYVNGEFNPNGAGTGNASQWQLAAAYENGPIYVAGGYHSVENALGVSAADAAVWRLAGAYDFGGMFKVTGLWDNTDIDGIGDRNAWSLGGAFMTGPHTIGLEYASAEDISNTPGVNTGSDIWSLVYSYNLSKRTMIHARYSAISNESGSAVNFYNNAVTANGQNLVAGGDVDGFMVGIRHTF
jgi:predicted porin